MQNHISRWYVPNLSLLSILTDTRDHYAPKVAKIRPLMRVCAIEIASNIAQATIIVKLFKSLQKLSETAFFLLKEGKDVAHLWTPLHIKTIAYAVALNFLSNVDRRARETRNEAFSELAKSLPISTADSTTPETFKSLPAANAVNADRSASKMTDLIKNYYLVSQGFIMAPLEILTYLFTLGPTLLCIISILTVFCFAMRQLILSWQQEIRDDVNDANVKVNDSIHSNHVELVHNLLTWELKSKICDMYGDFLTVIVRNEGQILITYACIYFVLTGQFELATMSSQLAAATTALARITKYLGLFKSQADLETSMNDRLEVYSLRVFKNESDDNRNSFNNLNEVEGYKTFEALKAIADQPPSLQKTRTIRTLLHKSKCKLEVDTEAANLQITALLARLESDIKGLSDDDLNADNTVLHQAIQNYDTALQQDDNLLLNRDAIEALITEQQGAPAALTACYKDYNVYLTLIAACGVMLVGFPFVPLPSISPLLAYAPTLSLNQTLSTAMCTYLGFTVWDYYQPTDVENIDSTYLSYAFKALVCGVAMYYGLQMHSTFTYAFFMQQKCLLPVALATRWPVAAKRLTFSYFTLVASSIAATVPAMMRFKNQLYQSAAYALDTTGIWVAQDTVTLLRKPNDIPNIIPSGIFNGSQGPKNEGGRFNPLSFLPRFV